MAITREQVLHVARLARLALSDQDVDRFTKQLSTILEHAEQVTALAAEDVPPTAHAVPFAPAFRPDVAGECLPQSKALSTAPETEQDRFKIPRIMEEEA